MRATKLLFVLFLLLMTACTGKVLTPATEVVYEGELVGNEDFTYASAAKVLEKCLGLKPAWGYLRKTMRFQRYAECEGAMQLPAERMKTGRLS